jgi:hypothetical protein
MFRIVTLSRGSYVFQEWKLRQESETRPLSA